MSNVKFSQLPNLGNITPTTIVPVVAANVNYTVTAANLQTYVTSTTGNITGGNISVTGAVTGTTGTFGNITVTNTATIGNIILPAQGTINVGNSRIQNVATPSAGSDAATKDYVDSTSSSVDWILEDQANLTTNVNSGDGVQFIGTSQQIVTHIPADRTLQISLANAISVSGNITGSYILGNGSQLTGLPATYGNANVATFLASYGSNTISTSGNITGGNVIATKLFGNGSAITGIVANVALQGNLQGNLVGNGFGANAFTFVSATGAVTAASVSASGNVQGSFVKGNGSELTGLVTGIVAGSGISISAATGNVTITNNNPTPYGNANVVANLAALSSNPISTTGNITGGNINTAGRVSAAGNVTGSFLFGNGSGMTGIVNSLTAGSGISLSGSTGNVTITATGGGGGGTSISNGRNFVETNFAGGKLIINGGNVLTPGNSQYTGLANNSVVIRNNATGAVIALNDDPNYRIVLNSNGGEVTINNVGNTRIGGTLFSSSSQSISAGGSITGGNILATGYLGAGIQSNTFPSTATGTAGMISVSNGYLYVCVATNTWKRVALSTF